MLSIAKFRRSVAKTSEYPASWYDTRNITEIENLRGLKRLLTSHRMVISPIKTIIHARLMLCKQPIKFRPAFHSLLCTLRKHTSNARTQTQGVTLKKTACNVPSHTNYLIFYCLLANVRSIFSYSYRSGGCREGNQYVLYVIKFTTTRRRGRGFRMQRRAITLAVTTDYSTTSFLL